MRPEVKRNICAFCLAMACAMGASVVYAFSAYYVAFQNATGYSNTQMGLLLSVLGIASTAFYLPNGYLADKFDVKKQTIIGVIGTGLIAVPIAFFPSFPVMITLYILYAVFGVLLGNSAVKMISMLASDENQGKMMSVRAIGKTLPLLIISLCGSGLLAMLSDETALRVTLFLYGGLAILGAIIAAVTFDPVQKGRKEGSSFSFKAYFSVMKRGDVWLIGIIGFCAYCASAGVTYLQPYLAEIFGISSALSSALGIVAKNCTVVAAPIITWIGMRKGMSITKALAFGMSAAAACFVIYMLIPSASLVLSVAMVLYFLSAMVIMGAWALMYVPVSESGIPIEIAGTAIGVVSMIGFCGDIFYWTICGKFIDKFGIGGYNYVFGLTAALMVIGAVCCFIIARKVKAYRASRQ